jgi:hypothetical protein
MSTLREAYRKEREQLVLLVRMKADCDECILMLLDMRCQKRRAIKPGLCPWVAGERMHADPQEAGEDALSVIDAVWASEDGQYDEDGRPVLATEWREKHPELWRQWQTT